MKRNKAILIGSYFFRSVTTSGNLCKTYCDVYSNGVTSINQVVLSNEDEIPRFTKIYSKFGKHLFVKDFGLKYESLVLLAGATTDVLNAAQIKKEDVIW